MPLGAPEEAALRRLQTVPFLDGRGSPIYPSIEGHAEDNQKSDDNDEPHNEWNFLF